MLFIIKPRNQNFSFILLRETERGLPYIIENMLRKQNFRQSFRRKETKNFHSCSVKKNNNYGMHIYYVYETEQTYIIINHVC